MTPDALCRVTIQRADDEVDVALPRHVPVGRLLPAIVDLVSGDEAAIACQWRLARIVGGVLDDALSLGDNEIRDGDILLLGVEDPPPPQWTARDPSHTVAAVHDARPCARAVSSTCGLLLVTAGVAALVRSDSPTALVIGAIVVVISAAAAVITRGDRYRCTALSVIAVTIAGAVGFRAIPTAPLPAHLLLASAAIIAMAVALARLRECDTRWMTAVLTASAIACAVCVIVVLCHWEADAGGAALAAASVAVLTLAPRIALTVAGITADHADAAAATRAHHTLTGVVAGTAAAAALGAGVAAAGELNDGSGWLAAGFPTLMALVAGLRSRVYRDAACRAALLVSGFVCAAIGFGAAAVAAPALSPWIGLLLAAVGLAALSGAYGVTLSPLMRRAVDVGQHVTLAAVLPAACWLGDVFGVVRSVTLT
jgi:type VII secretion integral membrane protein EccD